MLWVLVSLWWLDARVGCGQVRIPHVLISVFSLGGAVRGSRHRPRPSGSDVTMATTRDLWPRPLARPPGPAPALLPRDIQQVSSSLSELQHSRRSSSCPPERSSSLLGGTRLHALEEHGRRFSVITPPHSCPHSLLSLMMVKLQFVQISSRAVVFLCRRSGSSSSEVGGSRHESRYRKLSAPQSSSSETPPCCSLSATRQEEDPDPPSFRGSRGDLAFPDYSLGLTESSTPITTSLQQDQQENRSTQKETSNSVLEGRSSRTLRFTRQQSVGGASSHSQVYYPFPSRKTPRISEAAKRLGMYSSFWGGPGSAAGRPRGASQGSIRDRSIPEPINT